MVRQASEWLQAKHKAAAPIGGVVQRHHGDRVGNEDCRQSHRDVDAQGDCGEQGQQRVRQYRRHKRDKESQCHRARNIAAIQAPVRGIAEHKFERLHVPARAQVMALTIELLEYSARHALITPGMVGSPVPDNHAILT